MDSIQIKALTVATHIGVHAWEQKILQRLSIDITIPSDFSQCNDTLANIIDYERLCHFVTNYVESNSFQLIETVADKLAALIKAEFNIAQLTLSVSKPQAIKNAGDIRVTVNR